MSNKLISVCNNFQQNSYGIEENLEVGGQGEDEEKVEEREKQGDIAQVSTEEDKT